MYTYYLSPSSMLVLVLAYPPPPFDMEKGTVHCMTIVLKKKKH